MHLHRAVIDVWAEAVRSRMKRPGRPEGWTRLLVLAEGDSMDGIAGPAVVELIVFRDGGWSAREKVTMIPESVALTASQFQVDRQAEYHRTHSEGTT